MKHANPLSGHRGLPLGGPYRRVRPLLTLPTPQPHNANPESSYPLDVRLASQADVDHPTANGPLYPPQDQAHDQDHHSAFHLFGSVNDHIN